MHADVLFAVGKAMSTNRGLIELRASGGVLGKAPVESIGKPPAPILALLDGIRQGFWNGTLGLQEMDLSYGASVDDECADVLAQALASPRDCSLRVLKLQRTGLTNYGINMIARARPA